MFASRLGRVDVYMCRYIFSSSSRNDILPYVRNAFILISFMNMGYRLDSIESELRRLGKEEREIDIDIGPRRTTLLR